MGVAEPASFDTPGETIRTNQYQSIGSRWATLWNKGGLGLLTPSFGGG